MKVHEIVKITGLGRPEAPDVVHSTGLIYADSKRAEHIADSLWKSNVPEAERTSPWCATRYMVVERAVIEHRDDLATETAGMIDNTKPQIEWTREDLVRIWEAARAEIGGRKLFRGGPDPVIERLAKWKSQREPGPFWAWAFEPQGAYERLVKKSELEGTIKRVTLQPDSIGPDQAGLNGIVEPNDH